MPSSPGARGLGRAVFAAALAAVLAGCPAHRSGPVPETGAAARRPAADRQGAVHEVKGGQTLWRISRAYGVTVQALVDANGLDPAGVLDVGQKLWVPGARGPVEIVEVSESSPPAAPARAAAPPGKPPLAWPLIGVLYAKFGPRGETVHDGIDIAAPEGSPIVAAGDGTVLYSGEQRGYGWLVILDHGAGLMSLYAHNQKNLVAEGAKVRAGDLIARVGVASRTSGPHLHFEVRDNAVPRDPMRYLPPPR